MNSINNQSSERSNGAVLFENIKVGDIVAYEGTGTYGYPCLINAVVTRINPGRTFEVSTPGHHDPDSFTENVSEYESEETTLRFDDIWAHKST